MSVTPGTRVGVYEITALVGEGGMGQVYRAIDTRLKRQVAIKVLPPAWASDPERLARFHREAEVLAALNHPGIAHVHGFEESGGVAALVMEFVEGDTLAQKLDRLSAKGSRLQVDEALSVAKQIAEALEAAHEQGIVHRDLKPANIKVRDDGMVKLLDFGLAKAVEGPGRPGPASGLSMSPTLTSPAMTAMGTILGTAAYMSPEQARGKSVDRRTDIWAFGCVCYEMLTGTRAVAGDDVSDVLASVLAREPDWTRLPAEVPPAFVTYLRRCFVKDPRQRVRDIGDLRLALEGAFDVAAPAAVAQVRSAAPPSRRSSSLPWAVAAVSCAALAGVLVFWAPRRAVPDVPPVRLLSVPATGATLTTQLGAARIVLSPDATTVAFTGTVGNEATPQLFVRGLNELRATALAGTDNAVGPFFSPDSRWIGFFAEGKLKKVAVTGGAVVPIANAANARGATWLDDGTIVFAPETNGTLWRVSSAGGTPEPATTLGPGEVSHRWPESIGNGAFLFAASSSATAWSGASLVVQDATPASRTVVHKGGTFGRYLPNGVLLFVHDGIVFGAGFDPKRRALTSTPVPVLEDVQSVDATGGAQFSLSHNGTLVYVPGESIGPAAPIAWFDQTGHATPIQTTASNWSNPHVSPDGTKLAMDVSDGTNQRIWIRDLEGEAVSRLASNATVDQKPVWTPDGDRVTFSSARASNPIFNLYWQRSNGAGDVQRLTDSPNSQFAGSWHPGGKYLAFYEERPDTKEDVMILPIEGDTVSALTPGTPTVFVSTPAAEIEPMFSPDGRWIAYTSNESGTAHVHVRPFPATTGRWQISSDGGSTPTWSRTRSEILYRGLNGSVMSVPYTTEGDSFNAGQPRPWSAMFLPTRPRQRVFDLHPDGLRIVASPGAVRPGPAEHVVFVFNFFDEVRRLVSAPAR